MDLALVGSSLSIKRKSHMAILPVTVCQPNSGSKWDLK